MGVSHILLELNGQLPRPSEGHHHDHAHDHGSEHSHEHNRTHRHSRRHSRNAPARYQASSSDMEKVRSTLKQFVRDWSEEVCICFV